MYEYPFSPALVNITAGTIGGSVAITGGTIAAGVNLPSFDRNSITLLGDSRLAQMYADTPRLVRNSFNPLAQALALSGQRMRIGASFAVSGLRSDQYLAAANVSAALASNSYWLMVYGVVNDIGQNGNATDYWSVNIKPVVQAWIGTGREVILMTETGQNAFSGSSANMGAVIKYNRQIRDFCKTTPGARLFDIAALVMQPGTAMTFNANASGDGTHVNLIAGANIAGQALANLFSSIASPCDGLPYSVDQVVANGGVQWHPNPLWLTTSGGSTGFTGGTVTGTVPAGITAFGGVAGSSVAVSTAARADGYGNDLVLNITAAGAGVVKAQMDLSAVATENPGDVFYVNAALSVAAGASNFQWAGMHLQSNRAGTTTFVEDGFTASGNGSLPSGAYSWTSETERLTIASGTRGWLTAYIMCYFSAAGSATVKVGRCGVWRVQP